MPIEKKELTLASGRKLYIGAITPDETPTEKVERLLRKAEAAHRRYMDLPSHTDAGKAAKIEMANAWQEYQAAKTQNENH